MRRILFLIFLVFLTFLTTLQAQVTYYSVQSGDWFTRSTWSPRGRPTKLDTVIINPGHEITIDAYDELIYGIPEVAKLIIKEDGKLSFTNQLSFFNILTQLNVYDTLIVDGIIEGDLDQSNSGLEEAFRIYHYGDALGGSGLLKYGNYWVDNNRVDILPDANLTFNYMLFTIGADDTVRNFGSLVTDQRIIGSNNNSLWMNMDNSFLSVGDSLLNQGRLIADYPGNTIQYRALVDHVPIKTPVNGKYYNLEISSLHWTYLVNDIVVLNNFNFQSGYFSTNHFDMTVYGDWYQYGTFDPTDSWVKLTGTNEQNIYGSAVANFFDLEVSNPTSIKINCDVQIDDTLRLNTIINTGDKKVILGQDATNVGVLDYQSGKIIGRFARWIKSSTNEYLYPIGTSDKNTFVGITFPSIDQGGLVIFKFVEDYPGTNGLPLTDVNGLKYYNPFGEGYWVADTAEGFKLGNNQYSISLRGQIFNSFTLNDSTAIVIRPHADSAWRFQGIYGTNDAAAYKITRVNLDSFPRHYAFVDTTNCQAPILTDIIGPADVCRGDVGIQYIAQPADDNFIYYWTIDGGTNVATNINNDTILIDWDNNGQVATVSVYAQNSCTYGNTVSITVNVNSIPPSELYGLKSVPEGSDSVLYYIDGLQDYTYTWYTSSNASVDSVNPQTDSAWISFTTPGNDTIFIVAQYNNGCLSDTAEFPIYVYDVINSINSGYWDNPNIWDCSCVPQPTDNVRINRSHTVTLRTYYDGKIYVSYFKVNNLDIAQGGVLTRDDATIAPQADVIVDGLIDFSDYYLVLYNSNYNLSGIGKIIADTVYFAGSRTIVGGSDLTIDGDIFIYNNQLLNNGILTVLGDVEGTSSSTFKNGYNSTLIVSDSLLVGSGSLLADTVGNTVIYNGSNQLIKQPSSSTYGYYNLVLSGNGLKDLQGNISILKDLKILEQATLVANDHDITIYGDWYDYSTAATTFNAGTGLVLFNADGTQHIYTPYIEKFYDLKIGQNSTLVMSPKQKITVNNNFYLDGILDLYYDTTNDTLASFIYNNDIVYGTDGKVRTTFIYNMKHWYELSPAIVGTNSRVFTNANGIFNRNLYWYDESVDLDGDPSTEPGGAYDPALLAAGWKYVTPTDDGVGVELKLNGGYLFYDQSDDTLIMEGQVAPVTAIYDTTLSFTNNDPDASNDTLPNFYDGWNIIGNPYISYLSIDSLLNNATNVDNGVYIWDDVNGQYAGYQNGFRVLSGRLGPYIPPMQSFAVRANASGAVLKIRPKYRVHANQIYLKNARVDDFKRNSVKIGLFANNKVSYFATYFYPDATIGFNPRYDMVYMTASSSYYPDVPNLYALKGGVKVALEALPDRKADSAVIPLYVEVGISGHYSIKVDYIKGLSEQFVLLHDLKTGDLIDLRTNPVYYFDYETTDAPHRFDLLIVVDNAPEIVTRIDDKIAYEDSTFILDISQYFTDKDNFDSLHFAVDNGGANWLTFDGKVLSGTPTQQDIGEYSITVSAIDIFGKKAEENFEIDVLNTNDPPQLVNPIPHYTIKAGEKLVINFAQTFIDVDPGDSLSYTILGPDWIVLNPYSMTISGIPVKKDVGNYKVVLIATDKAGASAADTVSITVLDNPLLDNSPVVVYPNPVVDRLNVIIGEQFDSASLTVWDLSGQKLRQIQLSSNNQQINLKDLQPGSYIVRVEYDGKIYKFKITKQ